MRVRTPWQLAAIATAMFAVVVAGCPRKQEPTASDAPSAVAPEPEFGGGDAVVVEAARATFYEATVRKPGRTRLQLEVADGGSPREVDAANVYAIAERSSGAALPDGALAICRTEPKVWVGCRIEGRDGAQRTVADENGKKYQIAQEGVLKPTAVTELNLRQSFEQAVKRKVFIEGAREAGRPTASKGWGPKPGDHVLVASGEAYVSAVVKRARKGMLSVSVDGEGKHTRELPAAEVFPQPPVVFTPTAGTYVCVRPAAGESSWPVARIESASDGHVSIIDAQGRKRTVELRDVIPLAK